MDLVTLITLITAIITTIVAIWAFLFGGRGIIEGFLERRKRKQLSEMVDRINRSEDDNIRVINNLRKSECIGRDDLIREIAASIESKNPLTIITGVRGSGKTTIAQAAAQKIYEKSAKSPIVVYGAYIWIDARYKNLDIDSFLNELSIQLETPIGGESTTEKAARLRRELSKKATLIVVDNLDTLEDPDNNVRNSSYQILDFLENLPQASQAIVTTRYLNVKRGKIVLVGNLNRQESIEFIRAKADRMNLRLLLAAPDDVLASIYENTSGSPLAIEWVIGQVYAGRGVDEVIRRLRDGSADIYQTLFGNTWDILEPEEKQVLIDTTIARTSFSGTSINQISGFDTETTEASLVRLVKLMFVSATESLEHANIRYSLHPLTHLFVLEHSHEFPDERDRAHEAATNHYIEFVKAQGENAKAVEPEIENILYLISWCENRERWDLIMRLMDVLYDILLSLGYFEERIRLGLLAARGAEITGRLDRKAHYLILSSIHALFGQYTEVERVLLDALDVATSQNSGYEMASIKKSLAYSYYRQGKVSKAAQELDGVELVIQKYEDHYSVPNTHVDTLSLLGVIAFYLGDYDEAMRIQERMLQKCEEIGWERAKAYPLRDIAEVQMVRKDYVGARSNLERAFDLAENYSDKRQSARVQLSIAKLLFKTGHPGDARKRLQQASVILDKLAMKNEVEEIGALLAYMNTKPNWYWTLFYRWIDSPAIYAPEYPVGGD